MDNKGDITVMNKYIVDSQPRDDLYDNDSNLQDGMLLPENITNEQLREINPDKIPVFCTSEFSGWGFDYDPDKDTQAKRLKANPVMLETGFFHIYFDAQLEDIMRYDLVSLVDGVFPKLICGDDIDCFAITPDNKWYKAVMYVGKYPDNYYSDKQRKHYCLIRLHNDPLGKPKKAESNVTFEKIDKEET